MKYYNYSDALRYEFQCRWCNENAGHPGLPNERKEFPRVCVDLLEKYHTLEQVLNRDWHPQTTLGAAASGDGLLTDHGVDHINAVMNNAKEIIGSKLEILNGYEIYLLLIAIHLHDIGNIYGRKEHEEKIDSAIEKLGTIFPLDSVERSFVVAIAKSHSGYVHGSKDTIRYIHVDDTCNGFEVRSKVLAAILRFADEISDDLYRSYKHITVPKENEVYHAYSKALEPISIAGNSIKFHYRISYEDTQNTKGKGDKQVYLYDEIIERLVKCMCELEYCRKFADGFINTNTLNVTIDILRNGDKNLSPKEQISFRLQLHGYPDKSKITIDSFIDTGKVVPDGADNSLKYCSGALLQTAMKE